MECGLWTQLDGSGSALGFISKELNTAFDTAKHVVTDSRGFISLNYKKKILKLKKAADMAAFFAQKDGIKDT